ncbi:ligand-binding protein SH3 [Brevibacterium sp. UMB10442]|nr:ligand-binding protein SH3 [Brevibacterium sp. UMB10442]
MGKHSAPQKSKTSVSDFMWAVVGAKPRGRRAGDTATTATGVMRSVRRRPMLAAVVVPVAAGAALVTTATMVAGGNETQDSQVVAESHAADAQEDDFTASEGISVEAEDQDISAFASGLSKVGAKSAPEPTTPATSDSSDASQSAGSAAGSGAGDSVDPGSSNKPVSGEPCSVSSSIEGGLTSNAISAYRAVCANFPQVKSYGGRRNDPGSDHNSGQAVDAMIRGQVGDEITSFLIKNRQQLNIKYVIWEQKIYAPYTGWKGRPMENRGNDTANHFDHVHISVN